MLKYHFNISEDIKAVVQVQQLLVNIYDDVPLFSICFFDLDMAVLWLKNETTIIYLKTKK